MSPELLHSQVLTALHTVRLSLQADQADLEVLGVDDGTLNLGLLIGPETCTDCMMPRPVLEDIILRHVQVTMPLVRRVVLRDPREAEGAQSE